MWGPNYGRNRDSKSGYRKANAYNNTLYLSFVNSENAICSVETVTELIGIRQDVNKT